MTTTMTEKTIKPIQEEPSMWSSMNLLVIAGIMLTIGIIWRIVDQFILGLGDTWMNIMPSKLFPFLILIGFFWKYRRQGIDHVLGLSKNKLRLQISVGIFLGLLLTFMIRLGGPLIYGLFLDPSYPIDIHIVDIELLGYMFLFFLTNAFLEETLFRGLLQNSFKTRVTPNKAILLSAVFFGLWHAGWPILNGGPISEVMSQVSTLVFGSLILGLLFGFYYERFSSGQSLVGIIVIHTILNFVGECFKIGPDSGIQGPDIPVFSPALTLVSFVLFLITFSALFILFMRYKIEQVSALWKQLGYRLEIRLRRKTTTDNAVYTI
ncbi:MAG: CPBP family intramembrane metalloprotease [Candidatus Thorarchaeota archaeon]|nr:MAG: CPBP family intramembrane metalloprotease [Candidatus Thorarchaeota archaeon]